MFTFIIGYISGFASAYFISTDIKEGLKECNVEFKQVKENYEDIRKMELEYIRQMGEATRGKESEPKLATEA